MYENKRIYKVITPIERNGAKYWMRLGSAFTNADNSINIYLDAVPLTPSPKGGVTLQIRELTAEELRENAEKRAANQARRGGVDYNGLSSSSAASAGSTASDVPF
jgi:hypothetical protein